MNLIVEGYMDFSKMLVNKGIYNTQNAVAEMIKINKNLETDAIFMQLFPNIFMIMILKHRIEYQHKCNLGG